VVLRLGGRGDLLGRGYAHVSEGRLVCVRSKGVPHTFYVEAGEARALVGFAPMQFEGFLREVGEPAPERVLPPPLEGHPDDERLAPIAQRNGFEIRTPRAAARPLARDAQECARSRYERARSWAATRIRSR
jgi:hypothetical protein